MRNSILSTRSRSALVAGALMASGLLGSSSVASANTCRPWGAHLSAQLHNSHYDQDGNLIYGEATGTGYASYIGAVSVVGTDYFQPPANGLVAVDGDGVLMGSDGDRIFLSFDGTVIDLATGEGTGVYVVTGGTGRFANATGHAAFTSTFAAPNGFTVAAQGTLCY